MDKRTVSFIGLILISSLSFTQENKENNHTHHINYGDFTITIHNLPDDFELPSQQQIDTPRPEAHFDNTVEHDRSPTPIETEDQLQEKQRHKNKITKAKIMACTAIISAIITGGVTLAISLINYK